MWKTSENKEFTCLNNIDSNKDAIYEETISCTKDFDLWKDWPETSLYDRDVFTSWKVIPFYGFGMWIQKNCMKCPEITKFLKTIPKLKTALLSKLTFNMKIKPHRGWGELSNNILRCHYGIVVPPLTYVSVCNSDNPPLYDPRYKNIISEAYPKDYIYRNIKGTYQEIRFYKQFEWIIFDDSHTHYAQNMYHSDRIVLIVDIERPKNIPKGTCIGGDTSELVELIQYYKDQNDTIIKNS